MMKFNVQSAPYQRSKRTTTKIMLELMIALVIVMVAAIVFQFRQSAELGLQASLIIVVAMAGTLAVDVITAWLKGKRKVKEIINYSYKNYSYVTGLIFALTLPVNTHLYVVLIGAVFATAVAKMMFGGFGQNFANPAIVGRIIVTACFGATMADASVAISQTVTGGWVENGGWLKSTLPLVASKEMPLFDLLLGNYQGALGETFTLLIFGLGIVLAIRKVIDYRQPLFYLLTVAVASLLIALVSKNNDAAFAVENPFKYILIHLSIGGLMFGAIFMLTDPVTTPVSPTGKIFTSILAGILTVLIRVKAGAVEGVMYSILLVNAITPWVDSFIKGSTTKNISKKWIGIGAFFLGSILLTSLSGYIPKGEPVVVEIVYKEYQGQATGVNDQGKDISIDITLFFDQEILGKLEFEYKEEEQVSSATVLSEGDFYDDFVNIEKLKGKKGDEIVTLVSGYQAGNYSGDVGIRATYIAAMDDVLSNLPRVYSSSYDEVEEHGNVVTVTVSVYVNEGIITDIDVTYTDHSSDSYGSVLQFGSFFDSYIKGLVGITVEEAKELVNNMTLPTGTGETYTVRAYYEALKSVLGKIG